jgi:hypothetical protein
MSRKYEAKIDGDVVKARIDAQKSTMVEQVQALFAELHEVVRKAKVVAEAAGVSTILLPAYQSFARQCYKISKNFTGSTRTNEINIAFEKWVSRGLDGQVLADISELCGTTISGYT